MSSIIDTESEVARSETIPSKESFSSDDENIESNNESPEDSDVEKHPLLKSFAYGNAMNIVFGSALGKSLFHVVKAVVCSGTLGSWEAGRAHLRLVAQPNETDLGTLMKPKVENILALTKPSPFGKNGETVYDETVRKGLELAADQFTLDNEDKLLNDIKEQIQEKLFPSLKNGSSALTLKRYKMALYQDGGHFQFHRDTLHADNHQATLLLEVRSAHEGGTFVIDPHGDFEKGIESSSLFKIDFNKKGDSSSCLKWVAFYTDALHKVEPVTSGTRIVIQYDVYIKPDALQITKKTDTKQPAKKKSRVEKSDDEENDDENEDNDDDDDDDDDDEEDDDEEIDEDGDEEEYGGEMFLEVSQCISRASEFYQMSVDGMKSVLSQLDKKLSQSGTTNIAIPLFHRYSAASIKPELLKATDRLLFEAIAKTGKYVLGLSPITLSGRTDYEATGDNETFSAHFTYPMSKRYRWDTTTGAINGKEISKRHLLNRRGCEYIVSNREESTQLEHSSYKEYTGNEAEEGRFKYFLGVMVVGRK